MKKFLAVLLILVLVLGTITGCGGGAEEPSGEAEPFKVGAIYPLSGANALCWAISVWTRFRLLWTSSMKRAAFRAGLLNS